MAFTLSAVPDVSNNREINIERLDHQPLININGLQTTPQERGRGGERVSECNSLAQRINHPSSGRNGATIHNVTRKNWQSFVDARETEKRNLPFIFAAIKSSIVLQRLDIWFHTLAKLCAKENNLEKAIFYINKITNAELQTQTICECLEIFLKNAKYEDAFLLADKIEDSDLKKEISLKISSAKESHSLKEIFLRLP